MQCSKNLKMIMIPTGALLNSHNSLQFKSFTGCHKSSLAPCTCKAQTSPQRLPAIRPTVAAESLSFADQFSVDEQVCPIP